MCSNDNFLFAYADFTEPDIGIRQNERYQNINENKLFIAAYVSTQLAELDVNDSNITNQHCPTTINCFESDKPHTQPQTLP